MRNPGMIIQIPDGRKVIRYNKQPLLKKGKVVLHLLNEDYSLKISEGKEATIFKPVDEYNAMLPGSKLIGYVD